MSYRIYVVEDHPEMQRLYESIFTNFDAELKIFPDGNIALNHIRHEAPDLLLLDVHLPTINGLTVLKYMRVKLNLGSDRTKIVLVSADGISRYSDEAKLADACIEKPFTHEDILHISKRLLSELNNGCAVLS